MDWDVLMVIFLPQLGTALAGDMMRKSIVFDKMTPDVFYCPLDKPTSFEKMYVRSRPLEKLCEFDGKGVSRRASFLAGDDANN